MGEDHIGKQGDILIDPGVVREQARQTVKQLVDAFVELLTNSDDSYRRKKEIGGRIQINVKRLKKGVLDSFQVADHAEGMSYESLIDSLEYGKKQSGFVSGLPVRGFWGRGMKETIVAFGKGQIDSVFEGRLIGVEVWWDEATNRAKWRVNKDESSTKANGTDIRIVPDSKYTTRCPDFRNLQLQLSNHYALRGITLSREVWLEMSSVGRDSKGITTKKRLAFTPPEGTIVLDTVVEDSSFGPAYITIRESPIPIQYNRWDPYSLAGLIIKTEDVPLDNSLFGFDNEFGRYFFGEIDCPELADRIRHDSSLLTTTRTGIYWRHSDCRAFEHSIDNILGPLINKKKADLVSSSTPRISETHKNRLLKMLNKFANEELEIADEEGPGGLSGDIQKLTIKPDQGSAEPYVERQFAVYLPDGLLDGKSMVKVDLFETNGSINLSDQKIPLLPHPSLEQFHWGHFNLTGAEIGENTWVRCLYNTQEDIAYFEVKHRESKKIKKRKRVKGNVHGGFFKDIRSSNDPYPQQRVAFIDGIILYFIEFPVVRDFILSKRINTLEGKVLFAEMVSEAVCAALARKRIADGLVPGRPDEETEVTIARYEAETNRIKSKCLKQIHHWAESFEIVPGP